MRSGRARLSVLAIAVALSSCARRPQARDCTTVLAGKEDLGQALAFRPDVFTPAAWKRTHEMKERRVDVTWLRRGESGLAHQEYLLYPCGCSRRDLDTYVSEDNLRTVLLSNYQNVEPAGTCETADGRLVLRQFDAAAWGSPYRLRYWAEYDATRVRTLALALPSSSKAAFDQLSRRLFPALPSCRPPAP